MLYSRDKFNNKLGRLAICACLASLAACSVGNGKPPEVRTENVKVQYSIEPIDEEIYAAYKRAEKAIETLRDINAQRTGYKGPAMPNFVPAELLQEVSINWTGPIEGAVKQLAQASSFTMGLAGSPTQPVIVEMDAQNQPIISLLYSLGAQAGARANIQINPDQKRIEVVYAGN